MKIITVVSSLVIIIMCLLVVVWINNSQFKAKELGGTYTVNLPPNKKLITITWKKESLWILTKPMNETDIPEQYELIEQSNWGLLEGKVIINEKK